VSLGFVTRILVWFAGCGLADTQQLAKPRQGLGGHTRAQEAETPDVMEASGQHVQQEAADELDAGNGLGLPPFAIAVVLIAGPASAAI
jgi:hypothetical protein